MKELLEVSGQTGKLIYLLFPRFDEVSGLSTMVIFSFMRVIAGTYRSLLVSNTFMFNSQYMLLEILKSLSTLQRLFCLILTLVVVYTLLSATVIMVRLRSLATQRQIEDLSSLQRSMAALHTRSANLHQLIGATFYLFGFVFFLTIPFAFITLDSSKVPGWTSIFQNLGFYFAFSANVFFVFLVLHSVQWFVSARVRASALRLGSRNIS